MLACFDFIFVLFIIILELTKKMKLLGFFACSEFSGDK